MKRYLRPTFYRGHKIVPSLNCGVTVLDAAGKVVQSQLASIQAAQALVDKSVDFDKRYEEKFGPTDAGSVMSVDDFHRLMNDVIDFE